MEPEGVCTTVLIALIRCCFQDADCVHAPTERMTLITMDVYITIHITANTFHLHTYFQGC